MYIKHFVPINTAQFASINAAQKIGIHFSNTKQNTANLLLHVISEELLPVLLLDWHIVTHEVALVLEGGEVTARGGGHWVDIGAPRRPPPPAARHAGAARGGGLRGAHHGRGRGGLVLLEGRSGE